MRLYGTFNGTLVIAGLAIIFTLIAPSIFQFFTKINRKKRLKLLKITVNCPINGVRLWTFGPQVIMLQVVLVRPGGR